MRIEPGEYELSAENADLTVHTVSAGIGRPVGHDLTLVVDEWSASLIIGENVEATALTVGADLRTLRVVGGSGGAKPISDRDREEIVRNAQKSLRTKDHPSLTFTSTKVTGDWTSGTVHGELEVSGSKGPLALSATSVEPSTYKLSGTITQSDFGIKPFSAMLGALRVADDVTFEVAVEF